MYRGMCTIQIPSSRRATGLISRVKAVENVPVVEQESGRRAFLNLQMEDETLREAWKFAGNKEHVYFSEGGSPSDRKRESSSSISEMSLACLQDKVMQMEETNHCTNEELQGTLQELPDLQDQLSYLQIENERMTDEKAVLLESLCAQTEKLKECRTQITQLKQLSFQQLSEEEQPLSMLERESNLVDLLKKTQEAYSVLLMKQEDLTFGLQAAKNNVEPPTDLILLRDRLRLLESTVESMNVDKRMLEKQLSESQEQLSAYQIDIPQLKLQLENDQQKVLELQREREAGATSELNALLQETRKDKEKVEEKVVYLQEQLALTQREVARYKDQLQQLQEEKMVAKNNAHKQIYDLEYQLQQLTSEKDQLNPKMSALEDALQQTKLKCQQHLEDKRELKTSVGELQKALNETTTKLDQTVEGIEDMKAKHKAETDEWNKFQVDLLTTVRVDNDFKTEAAQHDVERRVAESKQLIEKILLYLRKVDTWILGAKVQVVSDHNPLTYLTKTHPHKTKLAGWALALERYNLEISYRTGVGPGNADALSRLPSIEI